MKIRQAVKATNDIMGDLQRHKGRISSPFSGIPLCHWLTALHTVEKKKIDIQRKRKFGEYYTGGPQSNYIKS